MKLVGILVTVLAVAGAAQAQRGRSSSSTPMNTLTVGQGIALPSTTSSINWNKGFTSENAAGAAQISGGQVNLMYAAGEKDGFTNEDEKNYGAEVGFGTGKIGVAIGYGKFEDDSTSPTTEEELMGARLGFNFGKVAFGISYKDIESDKYYGAGLIFNPDGKHRLGLMYETYDPDLSTGTEYKTYGVGYSYVAQNSWAFVVDASKVDMDGNPISINDVIKVTPGVLLSHNWLVASVSHDFYLEDENDIFEDHDKLTVGLGFKGKNAQLALYHKYTHEYSAALSFWF